MSRSCHLNVLQGVTLTDLKEAQRSCQDRQIRDGETLDDWFYLRDQATHDGGVEITGKEATETVSNWRQTEEVREEDECRDLFCLLSTQPVGK